MSDEQALVVDAIDALCGQYASPDQCERWDMEERFPEEAMAALADHGWSALPVAPAWGGVGASARDLIVVLQALARRSLVLAQAYYSLWVIGADLIGRIGSEMQRSIWLPRLAEGKGRIALALTEPDAGSDATALRTRAVRKGDAFAISGQKVFITGAAIADRIVTAVRTSDKSKQHTGITLLLIDPQLPGVSIRPMRKIGLKALDLCEVFFDDVHVPDSDILGSVDEGWSYLRPGLAKERLYLAAISVGAMCDVLDQVVNHARNRTAFGHRIGDHQMIAAKIARLRTAADAAACLVSYAATLVDAGDPNATATASAAKLFATEAYVTSAREGTQIFGGSGFLESTPVARHYRDCKYLEIGGGTSEIQTLIIARSMGFSP